VVFAGGGGPFRYPPRSMQMISGSICVSFGDFPVLVNVRSGAKTFKTSITFSHPGGIMKTLAEVRTLKVGKYVVIEDEPCKIVEYTTSKPGKHGEAKARLTAIGMFSGQKKSLVHPVTHKVYVPNIDKRTAQVIALMGEEVQLMDMDSYETFNIPIPDEYKDDLEPGKEIHYVIALDRKMITRV